MDYGYETNNKQSINAQILKMNPNYKLEDFLSGNEDAVVPAGVPSTAVCFNPFFSLPFTLF